MDENHGITYSLEIRELGNGVYSVFIITKFPDGEVQEHKSTTGTQKDAIESFELLRKSMNLAGILPKKENP